MIVIKKIKNVEEETFYHGSNGKIDTFVDDFVGKGNDLYGPGIYFSSDPFTSYSYISNDGELYICDLDIKKELSPKQRINKNILLKFMKDTPDEDAYTNWAETPNEAYRKAIENYTEYTNNLLEALIQIWYDWYRYYGVEYVRNLVKLGYDATTYNLQNNVKFVVVYNPKIIKIMKVYSKDEASKYIETIKSKENAN